MKKIARNLRLSNTFFTRLGYATALFFFLGWMDGVYAASAGVSAATPWEFKGGTLDLSNVNFCMVKAWNIETSKGHYYASPKDIMAAINRMYGGRIYAIFYKDAGTQRYEFYVTGSSCIGLNNAANDTGGYAYKLHVNNYSYKLVYGSANANDTTPVYHVGTALNSYTSKGVVCPDFSYIPAGSTEACSGINIPSTPTRVSSHRDEIGKLVETEAKEEEEGTHKYPQDCGKWLRQDVFNRFGISIPPGQANTWSAWFEAHPEIWQSVPNDGKFLPADIIVETRPTEDHGHVMVVGTDGVVYGASLGSHGPQERGDISPYTSIKPYNGENVTIWRLK